MSRVLSILSQSFTAGATSEARARHHVTLAVMISCAFFVLAAIYGYTIVDAEVRRQWVVPEFSNSYIQFLLQDRVVALAFVAFLSLSLFLFKLYPTSEHAQKVSSITAWQILLLCGLAFSLAYITLIFVHHSFDLSMDEYLSAFQSRIFLEGKLLAELPPASFDSSKLLQPHYVYRNDAHHLWAAHYRPVFAAFRALFALLKAPELVNPAFAAVSIWAICDISRRIFPDVAEAPLLSALLLLLSPQFLATAGSGFAFSAHLALNLIWLALFVRRSLRSHCAAAFVGFLATGLHQVTFHLLFAAPFLYALLRGAFGPRRDLIPYVVAYSVALPLWIAWPEIAVWLQTGDASALPRNLSDVDYLRNYGSFIGANASGLFESAAPLTLGNVFRYFLWLSPAILPLSILALLRPRSIGLIPTICSISFLISIATAHVLMPNQIHAWGSRYYHPVLGCSVLFATGGYVAMRRELTSQQLHRGLTVLLYAAAALFLPWRAIQIDEKVAPRAQVQAAIESIDADYVILADRVWFGSDFFRNDPFLRNHPLIASAGILRNQTLLAGKKVVVLHQDDLIKLGLPFGTALELRLERRP